MAAAETVCCCDAVGEFLWCGHTDGAVSVRAPRTNRVVDCRYWRRRQVHKGPPPYPSAIAALPGGKEVWVGFSDGRLLTVCPVSRAEQEGLNAHVGRINRILPHHRWVFTASDDTKIHRYEPGTASDPRPRRTLTCGDGATAHSMPVVSLVGHGDVLLSAALDQTAKVWSCVTGNCLLTLSLGCGIRAPGTGGLPIQEIDARLEELASQVAALQLKDGSQHYAHLLPEALHVTALPKRPQLPRSPAPTPTPRRRAVPALTAPSSPARRGRRGDELMPVPVVTPVATPRAAARSRPMSAPRRHPPSAAASAPQRRSRSRTATSAAGRTPRSPAASTAATRTPRAGLFTPPAPAGAPHASAPTPQLAADPPTPQLPAGPPGVKVVNGEHTVEARVADLCVVSSPPGVTATASAQSGSGPVGVALEIPPGATRTDAPVCVRLASRSRSPVRSAVAPPALVAQSQLQASAAQLRLRHAKRVWTLRLRTELRTLRRAWRLLAAAAERRQPEPRRVAALMQSMSNAGLIARYWPRLLAAAARKRRAVTARRGSGISGREQAPPTAPLRGWDGRTVRAPRKAEGHGDGGADLLVVEIRLPPASPPPPSLTLLAPLSILLEGHPPAPRRHLPELLAELRALRVEAVLCCDPDELSAVGVLQAADEDTQVLQHLTARPRAGASRRTRVLGRDRGRVLHVEDDLSQVEELIADRTVVVETEGDCLLRLRSVVRAVVLSVGVEPQRPAMTVQESLRRCLALRESPRPPPNAPHAAVLLLPADSADPQRRM
eukprot:TRINITY_DN26673_c0_g1_i1.p1 TRINITY_DN26673_c0_g1~~TRINITY_DN26673_c0_g1_i1.p1  ORF type:complete len:795 (+),score=225.09 TRINITY_DN26673_c0_g1_i1:50-2386(+)